MPTLVPTGLAQKPALVQQRPDLIPTSPAQVSVCQAAWGVGGWCEGGEWRLGRMRGDQVWEGEGGERSSLQDPIPHFLAGQPYTDWLHSPTQATQLEQI